MVYPDDGDPKREQVLNALVANMLAISPPLFRHDVRMATVFEGREVVLGTYYPMIVIVPLEDPSSGTLSCANVDHLMRVAIVGAISYVGGSVDWKTQANWLIADVQHAIANDLQLGGLAVYVEPNTEDVFDNVEDSLAVTQTIATVNYRHSFTNPSV